MRWIALLVPALVAGATGCCGFYDCPRCCPPCGCCCTPPCYGTCGPICTPQYVGAQLSCVQQPAAGPWYGGGMPSVAPAQAWPAPAFQAPAAPPAWLQFPRLRVASVAATENGTTTNLFQSIAGGSPRTSAWRTPRQSGSKRTRRVFPRRDQGRERVLPRGDNRKREPRAFSTTSSPRSGLAYSPPFVRAGWMYPMSKQLPPGEGQTEIQRKCRLGYCLRRGQRQNVRLAQRRNGVEANPMLPVPVGEIKRGSARRSVSKTLGLVSGAIHA